ncbi:hypothetical protein HELRODRAFT_173905 [Helobdella robusta]|uniref:Uncharacterized protein n=1 Tax=Helobdella robusta TaxID=6412 RepID=T1F7C7_HELRO|nr:hypothetical protein HELRODRAFT_173905 [Helobdella robusta]ESO03039.1 hypothetical protein HELRODRAFT_173905 [Helobdella robusta]
MHHACVQYRVQRARYPVHNSNDQYSDFLSNMYSPRFGSTLSSKFIIIINRADVFTDRNWCLFIDFYIMPLSLWRKYGILVLFRIIKYYAKQWLLEKDNLLFDRLVICHL